MKILMTGGTGLIGQALTKELLAKGHQVTILSRNPQKYQADMPDVKFVAWNGRTPEGWGASHRNNRRRHQSGRSQHCW